MARKTLKERIRERMCPKCRGRLRQRADGMIVCAAGMHVQTTDTMGFNPTDFPLRDQPPTVNLRVQYWLVSNLYGDERFNTEGVIDKIVRRQITRMRRELREAGVALKVEK